MPVNDADPTPPAPADATGPVRTPIAPPVLWRAPGPPADAIAHLAARHARASGGAITVLNSFGGALESRLSNLPPEARNRIEAITRAALEQGYGLARRAPPLTGRDGAASTALAALMGAAGGIGGLTTAIAELPVTIMLILHALQEVAQRHGFDPDNEAVRRETLRVFGSGGPLARDDGVDTAFITARLTLTGPGLAGMIATVAPRLAATLGPKVVAQSVPVLGAVAGAGINAAYMRYFRDMAEVRFGLLSLATQHDPADVLSAFRAAADPRHLPAR